MQGCSGKQIVPQKTVLGGATMGILGERDFEREISSFFRYFKHDDFTASASCVSVQSEVLPSLPSSHRASGQMNECELSPREPEHLLTQALASQLTFKTGSEARVQI